MSLDCRWLSQCSSGSIVLFFLSWKTDQHSSLKTQTPKHLHTIWHVNAWFLNNNCHETIWINAVLVQFHCINCILDTTVALDRDLCPQSVAALGVKEGWLNVRGRNLHIWLSDPTVLTHTQNTLADKRAPGNLVLEKKCSGS
ncbi:hypothetical protein ILYODFUR_010383 [Ilyodon furcidens]|uniref:Uncharacterized protein n=1 Tax=Ilyodon furcidens TaxID=33524 RepID=A0ABV0V1Y4_9TELE